MKRIRRRPPAFSFRLLSPYLRELSAMPPRRSLRRTEEPARGAASPVSRDERAIDDCGIEAHQWHPSTADDQTPDGVLMDRALSGEGAAFGVLVTRYQDRLYSTLVHVTGSADEAREITQEAFVRAFLKLGTFRRSAAFYTWLFRIAFNLRIGRQRRQRRHRLWEQSQRGQQPSGAGDSDPSVPLESAERAALVRSAIEMLAEDHREVLLLREMEGCCYEEISRILDVPIGTVRSRLHRARVHLRDELYALHQTELK
jgi:RNA polymerase sigma-70 factor, ECF subfamily